MKDLLDKDLAMEEVVEDERLTPRLSRVLKKIKEISTKSRRHFLKDIEHTNKFLGSLNYHNIMSWQYLVGWLQPRYFILSNIFSIASLATITTITITIININIAIIKTYLVGWLHPRYFIRLLLSNVFSIDPRSSSSSACCWSFCLRKVCT